MKWSLEESKEIYSYLNDYSLIPPKKLQALADSMSLEVNDIKVQYAASLKIIEAFNTRIDLLKQLKIM
jgi:hypothetical protein